MLPPKNGDLEWEELSLWLDKPIRNDKEGKLEFT